MLEHQQRVDASRTEASRIENRSKECSPPKSQLVSVNHTHTQLACSDELCAQQHSAVILKGRASPSVSWAVQSGLLSKTLDLASKNIPRKIQSGHYGHKASFGNDESLHTMPLTILTEEKKHELCVL